MNVMSIRIDNGKTKALRVIASIVRQKHGGNCSRIN